MYIRKNRIMKATIHIGWLIFWGFLLIVATYILTEYFSEPSGTISVKKRKDYNILTFKLPTSHDPDVFGPPLWKVRHFIADFTPCPSCRSEAVSHEKFFHDFVNKKTGKIMKFPQNYQKWKDKIYEL